MYPIITIGRQFGSGGYDIAKQLADQLGWKLFDRETLLTCAEEDDSIQELETFLDEKPLDSLLYAIVAQSGSREVVAKAGFDAVRQILAKQPSVLIGCCGNVMLRGCESAARIFLHAPQPWRVERIARTQNLTHRKAEELTARIDRDRASFHQGYTGEVWGQSDGYDLTINTASLETDEVAQLIADYVRRRHLI